MSFPVQKERKSGFLIPSFGTSSTKGNIAGESVYWAINRSADALVGAEYYSKRGFLEHAEFRARPSDSSYMFFNYVGIADRGIGYPPQDQGGEDARFIAERGFGTFRGVANVDYLSSFVFRIAFTDVYTQAIDSEVRSQIFLSNTTNGFHFNVLAERYQNFEVCNPSTETTCATLTQTELVRILHTPSLFISGEERQLGHTPLYWSFQSAAEGLQLREAAEGTQQGFRTAALVGRFDLSPSISMPLQWQGWSFRPELTLRDTIYTQQGNPLTSTTATDNVLNRKSLETSVELRPPALSRVFDHPWLGCKWKHVIEPRMKYDYVTGINNFADILRFDATDVLTNTNEIEYSLVNRLYAKHLDPNAKDCDPQSMSTLTIGGAPQVGAVPWELPPNPDAQVCASGPREILSWENRAEVFFRSYVWKCTGSRSAECVRDHSGFHGHRFSRRSTALRSYYFPPACRNQSAHQHRVGLGLRFQGWTHQFQHGPRELPLRPVYHRRRRCFFARDRYRCRNSRDPGKRSRIPPVSSIVWLWSAE